MIKFDLTLPALKDVFGGKFLLGNVLSPGEMNDTHLLEMFRHHYNALTCENCMKPMYIAPEKGAYNFGEADKMLSWAQDNGMKIIGHTLCWHGQTAEWMTRHKDGSYLSHDEARANLQEFITTYAGRYAGRIFSWDVLNEAFVDSEDTYSGNWREYVRRQTDNPRAVGHWYLAYGSEDYIFDAFYFARKADPTALLFYNDYNEEMPVKRAAIADMVNDLNAQWKAHAEYDGRLLIEGIGMQGHYNHKYSSMDNVREAVRLFASTGARLAITELDFTWGNSEEPAVPLTPEQSAVQAAWYSELFALVLENEKHFDRITFWAKDDARSWRSWGSPMLFDTGGSAKEAYYAVIGAMK